MYKSKLAHYVANATVYAWPIAQIFYSSVVLYCLIEAYVKAARLHRDIVFFDGACFICSLSVYCASLLRARLAPKGQYRRITDTVAAFFTTATAVVASLVFLSSVYATTGEQTAASSGRFDSFTVAGIIVVSGNAVLTIYCHCICGAIRTARLVITVASGMSLVATLLTLVTESIRSRAIPLVEAVMSGSIPFASESFSNSVNQFDHDISSAFLPIQMNSLSLVAAIQLTAWVLGVAIFSRILPLPMPLSYLKVVKVESGDKYISVARTVSWLLLTLSAFNCLEADHQTNRFVQLAKVRRIFAKAYVRGSLSETKNGTADLLDSRRILQDYSAREIREEGRVGIRCIEVRRLVREEYITFGRYPVYELKVTRHDGFNWSTRVFVDRDTQPKEYARELTRVAENSDINVGGDDLFAIFHKLENELLSKQQMLPGLPLSLTAPLIVQIGAVVSLIFLILFRESCAKALHSGNCGAGEPWIVCDASTLAARVVARTWVFAIAVLPLVSCGSVIRMIIAFNVVTSGGSVWGEVFHLCMGLLCLCATVRMILSSVETLNRCRANYKLKQAKYHEAV
jgi:hypothetical protein